MEPTETCRITRYSLGVVSMAVLPNTRELSAVGAGLSSHFLNCVLRAGLPNPDCDWNSPQVLDIF